MVGKTTAFANSLLKLLFQAVAFANVADNAAASPFTNIYYSAHTADPGASGTQSTSETSYTSYARQAVARTSGGHTVTNNVMNPVANIVFPTSTGGTPTLTHCGIGTAVSGAGTLWYTGTITPNIVASTTVPQTVTSGSTVTET